jgi:hypothetical protein
MESFLHGGNNSLPLAETFLQAAEGRGGPQHTSMAVMRRNTRNEMCPRGLILKDFGLVRRTRPPSCSTLQQQLKGETNAGGPQQTSMAVRRRNTWREMIARGFPIVY